jgi:2,4-dienoyl-CoA reductase-like NADH-dependent reductase (Old Yellow Enzyme family)/NADPH-dependent 2,4-dienoyl-CoA reductase/sulfur reductase-like enzyme
VSDAFSFPWLFSPFSFAGLEVPNRIVMAPMGTGLPELDGTCNDRTIAYYRRRAEGGVGMVTLEASLVSPDAHGVGPELRLHGEQFLPGLRRLVEALRPYGIPLGIQLWHPGRQTLLGEPIGPSAVPLSSRTPVPRALTVDDIHEYVDWYALSARICKEAGFDYVEVHGAHCYLPCEFISPLSNLRDDEYGGSLENRARFPLEIVRAIREACGSEYPISYRISGEEGAEGGFTLDDSVQVCRWLEEAGVSTISVSAGNWYALHLTIGPMFLPRGYLLHLARGIKAAVSVPVVAAGRLDDPDLAEAALERGDADLIAVGRGLIADPDWPRKVASGERRSIRPCIACNACVDLVARAEEARCAVNPEVGHELDWEIEPAAEPRRVMVVGAGPAGMEAARIARLRGHEVSIWDREPELGGKLDVASRAPSKQTVLDFRDFQARMLRELGVDVHTGQDVTRATVEAEDPDVVVVSVGADPLIPPIPGVEGPGVLDAQEILHGRVSVEPGERVVIVGGSATGCETAEWLLAAGAEATIVEMLPTVGQGIELITRKHLLADLRAKGLRVLTRAKVMMIEPGQVLFEHVDTGEQDAVPADRVALAVGWRPQGSSFAEDLSGRELVLAGDASRPADFVAAIQAGAAAGMSV